MSDVESQLTQTSQSIETAFKKLRDPGMVIGITDRQGLKKVANKMSIMPAQRLENFVPEMNKKGRLQEGADADLVIFDPRIVAEQAKYLDAKEYSQGMVYVMVNGRLVIDHGTLVQKVFPGRPVYSAFRTP